MSKRLGIITILFFSMSLFPACSNTSIQTTEPWKVGLIVPDTISDQVWGTKGYKGLLTIQSTYNVDVFLKKEYVRKKESLQLESFNRMGVTLVFGHDSSYSSIFNEIAEDFPTIHFVSFNGNATESNTTSLNFESYAMGYFGGMTAAYGSDTGHLGVIGAYDWQPEIKGFVDGSKFQNKDSVVHVKYINDWDDKDKAILALDNLMRENVDVVYPAGDGYNVTVIEQLKNQGLYAIGFVSDQWDLGENTVLTSTVQNVETLYKEAAKLYSQENLPAGNLFFDFQEDAIMLGKFSPLIDEDFQNQLNVYIQKYVETGKLPEEE
ncbi:transcriptional regulator [Bacillus coahuilensis m2-6]|uniref:BMP family ABC transporter substrate-binding protein n=2 Tax=Bacillus coahuilensis TaxID=408580 RepID=UPI0007504F7A|nr:BMP family ABC transporter substrate-binding protein [Bacillus coahuilensis]KUP09069.1 transcriptional regulator [Bacillus coahuilensis m2-6]